MTRTTIISFLALTIGIGSALAAGFGIDGHFTQGQSLKALDKQDLLNHAVETFNRADLNADNALDVDEYAALSIVTAELSILNGSIAVGFDDELKWIPIPKNAQTSLTIAERARLEAVARAEFYKTAGENSLMNADEFIGLKVASFSDADANNNGSLTQAELLSFAATEVKRTEIGA